ncbi:dihydrofolate reductase [Candidatus Saccharibacteria bacterium]|nr:dihydrofolate reductase [Candidatus Saccharibacteria bacterium]
MFSLISAVGKNRELGKNGKLSFRIKDDMKFFRETTLNHKVLMGRKTWESLPKKLKNRENFVVSRDENSVNAKPGPETADKIITDLPKFISENKDTEEEIFVIGGGMLYFELLPYAKNIYLTEIDATDPDADTFFPNFDESEYEKSIIKKGKENALAYSNIIYIKK